jgi:hypothetical protein
MQFRISDVSMLALGQKSRSLRTLRVSGCDTISDVGVNWLTEGCQALEELDLGSCTKVRFPFLTCRFPPALCIISLHFLQRSVYLCNPLFDPEDLYIRCVNSYRTRGCAPSARTATR